jgi:S-adenosylmethionine decarboxylase
VEPILVRAAEAANVTIVNRVFHQFQPVGVTGCLVLAQSHLSVHTWPELNYVAFDLLACGQIDIEKIIQVFDAYFCPTRKVVRVLRRGEAQAQASEQQALPALPVGR